MDLKPYRTSIPTPLGNAFFSNFNQKLIQKNIRDTVQSRTGHSIGAQNDMDLQTLMRVVFTDMARDPYTDVRSQVEKMNNEVVIRACETISTGMLQQLVYLRDISENPVPLDVPISTSTYGNKLPTNFKYGINKR